MKRRTFLKGTAVSGMLGIAASAGLLTPRMVLAAWPKDAFDAKDINGALEKFFGGAAHSASDAVSLKAPDIAENGAVVPITVSAEVAGITQMAVLISGNPQPMAASFDMTDASGSSISTRVKMGKTSDVIAVVKAGGKMLSSTKSVKVTIGGCGG